MDIVAGEPVEPGLPAFEVGVAEFVGPEETHGSAVVVGEGIVVVFAVSKDEVLAEPGP